MMITTAKMMTTISFEHAPARPRRRTYVISRPGAATIKRAKLFVHQLTGRATRERRLPEGHFPRDESALPGASHQRKTALSDAWRPEHRASDAQRTRAQPTSQVEARRVFGRGKAEVPAPQSGVSRV